MYYDILHILDRSDILDILDIHIYIYIHTLSIIYIYTHILVPLKYPELTLLFFSQSPALLPVPVGPASGRPTELLEEHGPCQRCTTFHGSDTIGYI